MAFKAPITVNFPAVDAQLSKFPSSRYMGSKHAILPFIYEVMNGLEFQTCLDAFSGSSAVSYLLKSMGKSVTSNDFLNFSYHTAQACIANSSEHLTSDELDQIIASHPNPPHFVVETFQGLYFTDAENQFLDNVTANIREIQSINKQSIALAALARACFRRRPRGLFTYTGVRYQDGRRDLQISLEQHFKEAVGIFNNAVFDNGQQNQAWNINIFNAPSDTKFDLIYLDPPYVSPHSDNDYTRRYHFVEGLTRYWDGLEILDHTKTKKFRRYPSPFDSKTTVHQAFRSLFERFADSTIVVSYSSNGIPSRSELECLLREYKDDVKVYVSSHRYSFGTHNHKVGDNQNNVEEYLFVGL